MLISSTPGAGADARAEPALARSAKINAPPTDAAGFPQDDGKSTFRWYWQRLRPHRLLLALAMLMMALEGAMLGGLSAAVGPLFDDIFVGGNRGALVAVGGAVMGLFVLRALASLGQRILMAKIGNEVSAALQLEMMGHILRLDSAWFTTTPPGVLMERVRGDTGVAAGLPASVIAAVGRDGVSLIALLAVAISIDWVWTLIAIASAPVLMLPASTLQRHIRVQSRKTRELAARLATRLDEAFHGITAVKLSGTESREVERYREISDRFVRASVKAEANKAGIPALMDIVAGIGFMGVMTYGGIQIINGEKTVGEFMSFFTALALVFEPVRRLGGISGTWAGAEASLVRLREILALRPTILPPAQPKSLPVPPEKADLVLKDVKFGYGETPVLRGLSFTAEADKTTALVGPSGAGKTTVFGLLARLIEPQSGLVSVGGVPVSELDMTELRSLFSMVSQESALFDESLRENITMGSNPTEAEIAKALEASYVDEFVARLPEGLDTQVGPRGSALSGGQRQRVAIARAVLRNRPILLLDEATSALDAASERAVQDALDRLAKGRTTLVIAHRLSTIRSADRIVVMDQGRAVEIGTHDELIAERGFYAALHQMQFKQS